MNENIQFLQAFLKNPSKVGSIAPSSPELARKMIEGILPNSEDIVLELGVGTGAITRALQTITTEKDSYLGIEIDPKMVASLGKKFPDLNIVCGSADDIVSIHKESGLGKIGTIICCLPFVSLPNEVSESILSEIERVMEQGCTFRTFQYAHGYYLPPALKLRKFMRDRYGKSKRSQMVVKNVPPAYTLTWSTL
jgi:phospholipid N-methyltransferase